MMIDERLGRNLTLAGIASREAERAHRRLQESLKQMRGLRGTSLEQFAMMLDELRWITIAAILGAIWTVPQRVARATGRLLCWLGHHEWRAREAACRGFSRPVRACWHACLRCRRQIGSASVWIEENGEDE